MDDLVRIVVKEEAGIPDSEVFVRSRAFAQHHARLGHVETQHDVVADTRRHTLEVCNISYDSTQRNRQDKIQWLSMRIVLRDFQSQRKPLYFPWAILIRHFCTIQWRMMCWYSFFFNGPGTRHASFRGQLHLYKGGERSRSMWNYSPCLLLAQEEDMDETCSISSKSEDRSRLVVGRKYPQRSLYSPIFTLLSTDSLESPSFNRFCLNSKPHNRTFICFTCI